MRMQLFFSCCYRFFFLLLFVLASVVCAQELSWRLEDHDSVLPPTRGAGRLVAADGVLVYWGGFFECFTSDGSCEHEWREDLHHYDLEERVWISITATSTTGTIPISRAFFAANYWDGEAVVVVFGGVRYAVNLNPLIPYGEIWFYSPVNTEWSLVTPTTSTNPGTRVGPNVAIYHDYMYSFGGINAFFQPSNDLWKFDLRNRVWTQLLSNTGIETAQQPGPLYLSSFRLDQISPSLVMHGGNTPPVGSGDQTNQTWSYSLGTGQWTQLASLQRGRIHNAAEIFNRKFVSAFGDLQHLGNDTGCRTPEASAGQSPTDEVRSLDLLTNEWTLLNVTGGPGPLKRVASTRHGNRMYVVGGYDYVCPGGPNTLGTAIWNEQMYSLKLIF